MKWWPRKREPVPQKIEVGILGATGRVGQRLLVLLEKHPWFEATWIAASERSAGRRVQDFPWKRPGAVPASVWGTRIERMRPGAGPRLVFSALPAAVAEETERTFASTGHYVMSAAPNFRMDPLVPLLVPDVNARHLALVEAQRTGKRWEGAIVTSPSCSVWRLAIVAAALRPFVVKRVIVAHANPVLTESERSADDVTTGGVEIEAEMRKVLGRLEAGRITPSAAPASVQQQAASDQELVWIELGQTVSEDEVREAFSEFRGASKAFRLPSVAEKPIRLERGPESTTAGLERRRGWEVRVAGFGKCSVLNFRFMVKGPSPVESAALGSLQNAELLIASMLFGERRVDS
jgi:aspartate-semialdehyde dehydrogenase